MRVGIGYDVHAFDPARPLVLGGVKIADSPGLKGWSDGDALTHAIIDALLGAASLGDIGKSFPEDDVPEGSASLPMLVKVVKRLDEQGFEIVNVDSIVVAEKAKIAPHRAAIRASLAAALGIPADCIGVKATTTDGIGFTGRQEGIACTAVALIAVSQVR